MPTCTHTHEWNYIKPNINICMHNKIYIKPKIYILTTKKKDIHSKVREIKINDEKNKYAINK